MPRRTEADRTDRLAAYRARRAAERTPEPFGRGFPGGGDAPRSRRFVVHEHRARRHHFDLRLEWRGVLLSWAVPKGPSLDPAEKRLAVRVEDHPLDYATFEGRIPEGSYGAGAVIVWDAGRWVPVEDPAAGLERGKLLFDLFGYKLRGRFTLVRTARAKARRGAAPGDAWLLIKKRDAFASARASLAPQSVHSGLTVDECAADVSPEPALTRDAARLGATRRRVDPARVRPMLAQAWGAPFSSPGWLFELKYDGYRVIAATEAGRARLFYRSGREATPLYPELTAPLAALPVSRAILDGEIVVFDAAGRPCFAALQARAAVSPRRAARAAIESPAALAVFDLLALGDLDLRGLALRDRKQLLARLLPKLGPLRLAPCWAERGLDVFREIERLGLEGMVAKRADAPYRAGRSPAWRKIRIRPTLDLVIVGWTAPRGGRAGLGALHLAARAGEGLRYVGRVGSGLGAAQLRALRAALEADACDAPPCCGAPRRGRGHHWCAPRRVAEVQFTEWTPDGLLRQPVFLRLRDDKKVGEIDAVPASEGPSRERTSDTARGRTGEPVRAASAGHQGVQLSNTDKVFWPDDGTTKGDLLAYYEAISPWLLPYLADRPLVVTRHPDGIAGKSFFQKDAPSWAPEWLRTETLWSEQAARDIHYFVCDDLDALRWIVNLGAIPLHVWSSRVASLARPDWCILDIDPKGAPFRGAVAIAREIRALGEQVGLPTYVKTSGSEGLHVLVPLGGRMTYEQSRRLGELVARVVVARLPDVATLARQPRAREGKVYLDTLQNGYGKLLVAPFAVRPLPGAPVSMPLHWREVGPRLDPRRFHLRNAVARVRRLGADPLRRVLDERPDLVAALDRLAATLRRERAG